MGTRIERPFAVSRLAAACIGGLVIATAGRSVAALSITAGADNRSGNVSAYMRCGDPIQAGYNVDPRNEYDPISFDQCVQDCTAEACLASVSSWQDYNPVGGGTTGFSISSVLSAEGSADSGTFSNEQVNVSLVVSGLGAGETAQFIFAGSIASGSQPNTGSISASLSGPGVSISKNAIGSWSQAVDLGNGTYTIQVMSTVAGTVAGTGLVYSVSFDYHPATLSCGSPDAASCFTTHAEPYCNDATCCEAVCADDPFCCDVSWDNLCLHGALDLCYPDVPLCQGLGRDFEFGQQAAVPSFGEIAPTTEITIEFWQRIDGASQNTVIACQSGLSNRIVTHTPWTNGNVIFDFGAAFGGGRIEAPAPPGIDEGWHHFAFVASNLGEFMRIYHNGELLAQSGSATQFAPADVPLSIASNFVGAIDELRIWNAARSAEQIAASFAQTVPFDSANLVVYYRMDSTAENTLLVDRSNVSGSQNADLVGTLAFVDLEHEFGVCYPDEPLCHGLARGFLLSEDAEVAGFGLVAPTHEITIEFWQRIDGASQNTVIACQSALSNRIVTHTPWTNGHVIFDFGAAFGGGRIEAPAPPGLDEGWHHFAFVASDLGEFMRIHHNGKLLAQSGSATQFAPVDVPLVIANNIVGSIDELRIWSVARTPDQICDTWYRTVPTDSPGLLAYYRMDSESETGEILDLAGPGGANDAVVTGAPESISEVPCVVFGDLNADGLVNGADLGLLLSEWGSGDVSADLNCDGIVNGADLGLMLGAWAS